jgi:hypothetical protein
VSCDNQKYSRKWEGQLQTAHQWHRWRNHSLLSCRMKVCAEVECMSQALSLPYHDMSTTVDGIRGVGPINLASTDIRAFSVWVSTRCDVHTMIKSPNDSFLRMSLSYWATHYCIFLSSKGTWSPWEFRLRANFSSFVDCLLDQTVWSRDVRKTRRNWEFSDWILNTFFLTGAIRHTCQPSAAQQHRK